MRVVRRESPCEVALEESGAERRRAALAAVKAQLEDARLRLHDEISTYPRPVPGCDAQFNHLLDERAGLGRELGKVDDLLERLHAGETVDAKIAAFLAASEHVDQALADRLRSVMS